MASHKGNQVRPMNTGKQGYGQSQGFGQHATNSRQGYGQSILTRQTGAVTRRQYTEKPPDCVALACFACLCCCWPLGLIAIFVAQSANTAAASGDFQSAQTKARIAIGLIVASIVIGVSYITAVIILVSLR